MYKDYVFNTHHYLLIMDDVEGAWEGILTDDGATEPEKNKIPIYVEEKYRNELQHKHKHKQSVGIGIRKKEWTVQTCKSRVGDTGERKA